MPGTRANTKDSVSADIVCMLWWGRQTVYINSHIPGCAVKRKNKILGKNDGRYTLERVGRGDVSGRVTLR